MTSKLVILVYFMSKFSIAKEPTPCPSIVTRAEWGAWPANCSDGVINSGSQYLFIHHTAEPECYTGPFSPFRCHFHKKPPFLYTHEECIEQVQYVQYLHQVKNNWCDVGYSFLIGNNGEIFEGMGWEKQGHHTKNFNELALAVVVTGNFMDHLPTPAVENSLKALIDCGLGKGKLKEDFYLLGHRQNYCSKTLCPGDHLLEKLKSGYGNFQYGRQKVDC